MKLLRALATVSGMTLLSRISGFARDVVITHAFGAGAATDAFWVAFRIPNLFRRLVGEGSFSLAFVPVLAEYKTADPAALKALIDRVAAALCAVLLLLTGVGLLLTMAIRALFADTPKDLLTSELTLITFPYIFFISLTAFSGAILNSFGRFAIPAVTPVLLNLSMIGAALLLAPKFANPIEALAWGVLIAGVLQLAVQIPALRALQLLPRPTLDLKDPGVRKIGALMLPTLFGSSVAQVNVIISTAIAYTLIDGSVTWLSLTDRLLEFPLGLFGVALGTVILPHLSSKHVEGDEAQFRRTLDWGVRLALLIALPAMVGLALTGEAILSAIFQYGAFDAHDTRMTALSLMALSFGLPGFVLLKVLAPGFFARQDAATPVRVGLIALAINTLLNFALVHWALKINHPAPHAALALSAAIGASVNALLLFWILKRRGIFQFEPAFAGFAWRLALALVALVAVLYALKPDLTDWQALDAPARLLRLGVLIGSGASAFALVFALTGGLSKRFLARPG
jgi:putative peptidoglycan lipid II flippase